MTTKLGYGEQVVVHFPLGGIDRFGAFAKQSSRKSFGGRYVRTTPDALNVRGFDRQNVFRGGSRPGLFRRIDELVAGSAFVIQDLTSLAYTEPLVPAQQVNQSGRVNVCLAVSRGKIKTAVAGATAWTEATYQTAVTPPLNPSGIVLSCVNQQRVWFADGTNWVVFDPRTNIASKWTATEGTLPVDSHGNAPRLIERHRGRNAVSGLIGDPQDIFFSAQDAPTNFDYGPQTVTPTTALALGASPLGLVGDLVTGMVSCTDDAMVIGCDSSIWLLSGDPMDGGKLSVVVDGIGMAWGRAWCQDPFGNVYFMSNRTGIYAMQPGSQPTRISKEIDRELYDLNLGESCVRLCWNDQYQGFHVFVTSLSGAAQQRHFFYEARSSAWWFDRFANNNHNPLCCVTFDGNLPEDRIPLIGSWDGYVRAIGGDAEDDDGTPIESYVFIGPFLVDEMDDLIFKEVQGILDTASGDVTVQVMTGRTAQQALAATAAATATWVAGRNKILAVRRAGHALYMRIGSTDQWAMESLRILMAGTGRVRQHEP